MARPSSRKLAAPASLLVLLGVAACAPAPTVPAAPTVDAAGFWHGVIVAMRPVSIADPPAGPADIRATILGAIGDQALARQAGAGDATEFIVRGDDGRTLSVVQTNQDRLQPGERVMLSTGAHGRIAPAPG